MDTIHEQPDEGQQPRRKPISKRLRYEILRRDNHACRYCGATAPGVKLTIDHVIPVALGGSDEPGNLVTACAECNAGKSATSPDQGIVQDVEQDALRWRAAMMRATALAIDEQAVRERWLAQFREMWGLWTHSKWTPEGRIEVPIDLPDNWRLAVEQFRGVGLTWGDFAHAIEVAMTTRNVKDEFAYMLAVLRGKHAERVAVARALLNEDEG